MQQRPVSKEEQHRLNCERFKKTPEEREQLKAAKAQWKKLNPKKK